MLQLFVAWIGSAHAEAPTVLKVWHAYRDAEADVLESILQDYDTSHPEITVEVLPVAYDAYGNKLESAIPRNNGPDVFIYAHEIGFWVESGLLLK